MNRLYTIILFGLMTVLTTTAAGFANETLHYKVDYKWGLVNKTAGNVTVRLNNKGDRYACNLVAASAPWADKIYRVRDTLRCEIVKDGFKPVFYAKNSHEGSDDKRDYVAYRYQNGHVFADCVRKKWEKGKLVKDETRTLEAQGTTVDMLSAFYYMRELPYNTWTKGHVLSINIFSGKRKELLTIKYHGTEKVTYDKKSYDCYHITFIFTSNGKKKTSENMDAWISTDASRIPVKLEGSLPIGKVRCFYTG